MTYRIVNIVRSLAIYGAVSLGLRRARIDIREPDALRSGAEPEDPGDDWMFGRRQAAVSAEACMLDQEYARVSGALASLRAVLSNLTKMPLHAEEACAPVAASPAAFDPALFDDIAPAAALLTNVVAFDEDDLFIESSLTLQKPSTFSESLSRVA